MRIYSIYDDEFRSYGKIMDGFDSAELIAAMKEIPLPEAGTDYLASIPALEKCRVFSELELSAYGGLPVELGMCWGHNRTLNCLEYHRTSEINMGADDFILLLAHQHEIENGLLSVDRVRAFQVPAGVFVEIYATTLHYVPCHVDAEAGFRTAVLLPRGTNLPLPGDGSLSRCEDKLLSACNKWLLAHPDSAEAKSGSYIGLVGDNITI